MVAKKFSTQLTISPNHSSSLSPPTSYQLTVAPSYCHAVDQQPGLGSGYVGVDLLSMTPRSQRRTGRLDRRSRTVMDRHGRPGRHTTIAGAYGPGQPTAIAAANSQGRSRPVAWHAAFTAAPGYSHGLNHG